MPGIADMVGEIRKLQEENDKLKADLRGKDNEINDLKARIAYLEQFKPKEKNIPIRQDIPLIMENYELKKNIFKDNELEYYMKIIDIEEVEDELNREFDMDSIIVKRAMRVVRDCILDKED